MAKITLDHNQLTSIRSHLDQSWWDRANHWLSTGDDDIRLFTKSRRVREPLIISGHGARLWVNNGCLIVRQGFTHYPQKNSEYRFFPNDRNRPSRIIVLDGSGALSFDALDWLARNDVPLIRINWRGDVQTAFGTASAAIDRDKARRPLLGSQNGRQLNIASKLILEKIKNSVTTLKSAVPRSPQRAEALSKLKSYLDRLHAAKANSITQLMGIEGIAAIAYFSAWQSIPIKWEGTKRKPIPPDWYQVGLRSSVTRLKTKNRNASHPVNAMLNYAYAVLESQVRIRAVAAGLDPKIGYLHKGRPDRDALIFDLMEPLRPIVDRRVLLFIQSNIFEPNDFTIRPDGVCRLHPELAATVVATVTRMLNQA